MYDIFAEFYDRLIADADYNARTNYLMGLFEKYDRIPSLLLDLACGTGGFSNAFASRGVQVIGVDISPEMLMKARENSAKCGNDILYLCQDATCLDLYGTVDGAICCLDSLNHITDYSGLKKAISRISLFLEPERLFIFDVNTVFKHKEILGDNTFILEEDDVYCVWSNEYIEDTSSVFISLNFFEKQENGLYSRHAEEFSERAYTEEEIRKAVSDAGLEILDCFEEMSENAPKKETQRIVYITRKV